jgi:hypothetical protein
MRCHFVNKKSKVSLCKKPKPKKVINGTKRHINGSKEAMNGKTGKKFKI